MSKHFRPLPVSMKLAETLGQRIAQLREFRNMTVRDLASACRFGIKRIEDIESGLETWFSVTERQLIARALLVAPTLLQEVEKRSKPGAPDAYAPKDADLLEISSAILAGELTQECPVCGNPLKCSIQEAIDHEEKPIQFARAYCPRCPFILK